ncbi:helix-turn-helix transcriptional regulator [Phytoactinopolyspora endophytica]|uniref:helix-turn-helix transcriptional regulator n=1 Tax=Phytoactinopolyspora endophytica TaxID=1642495 RepID=UPI00101D3DD7|nr:YafY family protein [Phytoactinopolyspora endophytica]
MKETSGRLLRLLTLLQTRRDWPGAELAVRLGVTTRTVRRDVERLRDLGYPVHAGKGITGGYRLDAGKDLPPLLLDDDEAVAVAVSLQTAAASGVTGVEETALRALVKLRQVLPVRLRHQLHDLQLTRVQPPWATTTVDPDVLATVAAACRNREQLRINYRNQGGTDTTRVIEPHEVVNWGRRWYLVAWDLDRDDWRTFRIDRLRPWTPSGLRFTPRELPGSDAAAFVAGRISDLWPCRATVLLHTPATSQEAQECMVHGRIERVDDDTCLLHLGADDLHGVAFLLGALKVDFTVREPPELADHLRAAAARFHRATPD